MTGAVIMDLVPPDRKLRSSVKTIVIDAVINMTCGNMWILLVTIKDIVTFVFLMLCFTG